MKLKLILLLIFVLLCNNVQHVQAGGGGDAGDGDKKEEEAPQFVDPVSAEPEQTFDIVGESNKPTSPGIVYVILMPVANFGQIFREGFSSIGDLFRNYQLPESRLKCAPLKPQYQCAINVVNDDKVFQSTGECREYCSMRQARCCQFNRVNQLCTYSVASQKPKLMVPIAGYYYASACSSPTDKPFERVQISDYCGSDKNWKNGFQCQDVEWFDSHYITDMVSCSNLCRISKVQGCCSWESEKNRCGVSQYTTVAEVPTKNKGNAWYCSANPEPPTATFNTFNPREGEETSTLSNAVVVKSVKFAEHNLEDPNKDGLVKSDEGTNFVVMN